MKTVWVVEQGVYDPLVVEVFGKRKALMDWFLRGQEHALATRILAEDANHIEAETDFPSVPGVVIEHTAHYEATKWTVR